MKNSALVLGGLISIAFLALIGVCLAEDSIGADESAPVIALCPDIVDDTATSMEKTSTYQSKDICGKTFKKSPGQTLSLSGPSGTLLNPLVYQWTVLNPDGSTTNLGDDKDVVFAVPTDALCLDKYIITLTVSNKWLTSCQDACTIKVLVDCGCPEWNKEFCYSVDSRGNPTLGDTRESKTYTWTGSPSVTVDWYLGFTKIATGPSVTIDWRTKGVGVYALTMVANKDGCPCKICISGIVIVPRPDAVVT
jgi:hypothetical protein